MNETDTAPELHPAGLPNHLWQGDIKRIDHSVIRVPDLEAGISWYRRLLGLVESERRSGRVYLASPFSGETVLGLTEGGTGLAYVSYRVRGAEALERIAARLQSADIAFERGHDDTRSGAVAALRLELPTGHVLELLQAEETEKRKPAPGYVAGAMDVRTSHLQLRTLDVLGTSEFMKKIGFKVSTYVPLPDGKHLLQFMRVNEFHHQLAILTGTAGLHHVALELDVVDFWKFCDHLSIERIPAEYGPGRHLEGDLLFIYVRDPFGNRLEITGPMALAGFDYPPQPGHDEPWYHMNRWGPQPPESWYHEWT
ncbi:MAG TPA: VOC family protein [Sphingomonas sp.]|nr:VOC family protein [Sphingomonas sp.]